MKFTVATNEPWAELLFDSRSFLFYDLVCKDKNLIKMSRSASLLLSDPRT